MHKRLILLYFIIVPFILKAQVIDVSTLDTLALELNIPNCSTITTFSGKSFNNLRKITFNGIDNLPPSSFRGLPNLEEVVFNGDNFIIGGAQFFDLPKLKKVVFNGNTFLMNGSGMVGRCPLFEDFEMNGLFTLSEIWDPIDSPQFNGYSGNFLMLYNGNSKLIQATSALEAAKNKKNVEAFSKQLGQATDILENYKDNLKSSRNLMYFHPYLIEYAIAFGTDTTAYASAYRKARMDEYFWSDLEVLQNSSVYTPDTLNYNFSYASPNDTLLEISRRRFNLDSIAGNGSDISRMINLMYWVHNNIRHDGSSYNPEVIWTLPELYDICKQDNRGVNCRMLAIALSEALLAEGIPSRYLTCQSKKYDTDSDCHVICVAWSTSLNKWVWLDPTFAAYVTDENGLMLHPGEVRQRIIDGTPLYINDDANWNNEEPYSKEEYLDGYMVKNLYYITANLINKASPEGYPYDQNATYVTLAPVVHTYKGSQFITSDNNKFWIAP